ncbi:MAG: outer membrane beta-barrel protein [Bacteroidia bacterium]
MREFYFERLIREKLQNMEVSFNPEDWKDMEVLLNEVSEVESQPEKDDSKQEISEDILLSAPLLSDFDKEIAQKLNSISEQVPNDWELFASELDNDLFDQAIKEKIEQIPPENGPSDWNLLESKLDGNSIDSVFRKTLINYRVPFYAPDWLLLSEVLNQPFDRAIKEKLAGLTLGYTSKDWRIMSAKLSRTPDIISNIPWYSNWKNYVSYASAIILILLSIGCGQFIHTQWNGQIQYVEYLGTPDEKNHQTHLIASESENQSDNAIHIIDGGVESLALNSPDNPSSDIEPITLPETSFSITEEIKIETLASSEDETKILKAQNSSHISPAIANSIDISVISIEPITESPEDISLRFNIKDRGIHRLEPNWDRKNPELRIGVFASNTSSRVELTDPGELGYMAGLRLELMIRPEFSVVTGLNYSLRNITYESQIFIETNNIVRRLDQTLIAHLEMVELPILFRYNFPTQNRLNLYAQGGVITAVSIREDYQTINNEPSPFGSSQSRPAAPIDERKYNTYVGNIYAAAGFEYKLSSSLAIQIEPYFQMNMQKTKGVAAQGLSFEKQVYTAGIGLGLFYQLKKQEKR